MPPKTRRATSPKSPAKPHPNDDVVAFPDQASFTAWLEEHHEASPGVWLRIAKKGSGIASITHPEALESAICFGWIDGQRKALDAETWLQRFCPRSTRSIWSTINREKALALIAAGRMRAAGQREVDRARADGRWEAAYEGQRTAAVPADLAAELARRPRARAFFEALDSKNRYAILFRLKTAKLPATRARRLQTFVDMLEAGEKLHP